MQNRLVNPIRIDYHWPLLFLIYFSLQIVLRTVIGRGLGIDEAQLMLTAQTLEWGYGAQPPLYSWLQHGVFSLFGETIFALSLLKNSLLCLTYLTLFRTLCDYYDKELAGLATLSLLLLPQIGWESQRALSHSVLATAMASVTLFLFSRLVATRQPRFYVLFGAVVALGALSKFNYVVLPIAMLMAAISLQSTRRAIFNPKILLSLLTMVILLFMPVQWMIAHSDSVLESVHKFDIQSNAARLKTALTGVFSLTEAGLLFLAPLIMVLLLLYLRYQTKIGTAYRDVPFLQFLLRTIKLALILILMMILWSGTTTIKDRWLQPVLFLAAPAMTLWLLPRLSAIGHRRFLQIAGIAALAIFIAQPIHDLKPSRRSTPFPTIVALMAEKYPEITTVLAKDKWLGGNLYYVNKGWTVTIPGRNPDVLTGEVVIVWPSRWAAIPRNITSYLAAQHKKIISVDPVTTVKIPFSKQSEKQFTINFTAARLN